MRQPLKIQEGDLNTNNIIAADEIKVFPNPAKDNFNIILSAEIKNARVEVYNMLGEKMYSATLNNKPQTINNKFPSGIYFVKVAGGEKQFTEKLIVQ